MQLIESTPYRLVLNYKGISYKEVFIPYTQVDPTLRSLGFMPSGPRATVPAIAHAIPTKGTVQLVDSIKIAQYLDEAFPDHPIFPGATKALQLFFVNHIESTLFLALRAVVLTLVPDILYEDDANFLRGREDWAASFGKPLEKLLPPPGPQLDAERVKAEATFAGIAAIYQRNDSKYPFILGNEPVFADFVLFAILIWIRKVRTSSDDGAPWDKVKKFQGGKWERFAESLKKYEEGNQAS
jgi:glutathione S-transferase